MGRAREGFRSTSPTLPHPQRERRGQGWAEKGAQGRRGQSREVSQTRSGTETTERSRPRGDSTAMSRAGESQGR